MPITITPTAIPDVLIIEPKVFGDDRGWFFESFNQKEFSAVVGRDITFVQDNHSSSKKGVLRGLHYQMERTQGKIVRVIAGVVYDVVVDLRQYSKTYGHWVGVELSSENRKQLWIPEGFAHGFLTISDRAEFLYKTTDYYHSQSEKTLLWSDSELAISWPNIGMDYSLTVKDLDGVCWGNAPKF
jgi:dTDP-4-dehydrorhamnose 3,5-epimerase